MSYNAENAQHSTQGVPAPSWSLKAAPHNRTDCNYNGYALTILLNTKTATASLHKTRT